MVILSEDSAMVDNLSELCDIARECGASQHSVTHTPHQVSITFTFPWGGNNHAIAWHLVRSQFDAAQKRIEARVTCQKS